MRTRKWTHWAGILLTLVMAGGGLFALLWFQGYTIAANVVSVLFTLLAGVWTLRGLYVWRAVGWVRWANSFVILGLGFGLVFLVFRAAGFGLLADTTLYLFGAVGGFLLGVNLIRLALTPGGPVFGVARSMVEEAIRSKIAAVFVLFMLVILVAMPLLISSDDRLTYIVQRFLTWSLMAVSFLLSTTTLALCAYTTSYGLKSKQVEMTLVKPLSRPAYLLGKWLGVVMLNAVLLVVSGVAITGFARALSQGQAMNTEDREQVQSEVLTARQSSIPQPENQTTDEMFLNTLEDKRRLDPEQYGEPGSPVAVLPERVRQTLYTEALTEWFTLNPDETETFVFTGLTRARANAQASAEQAQAQLVGYGLTQAQAREFVEWWNYRRPGPPDVDIPSLMTPAQYTDIVALINREQVQLVLRPDSRPEPIDSMVEFNLSVNGQPWPVGGEPTQVAVAVPQKISLPAWLVNQDGELMIRIDVPPTRVVGGYVINQNAIQFNRSDQVPEVFYRVGSFEANLAKALGVIWVRLAFLAMLGLTLGALFTFPVACLMGLMVYAIAAFSGYLNEAVTSYTSIPSYTAPSGADSTWEMVTGACGKFSRPWGKANSIRPSSFFSGWWVMPRCWWCRLLVNSTPGRIFQRARWSLPACSMARSCGPGCSGPGPSRWSGLPCSTAENLRRLRFSPCRFPGIATLDPPRTNPRIEPSAPVDRIV